MSNNSTPKRELEHSSCGQRRKRLAVPYVEGLGSQWPSRSPSASAEQSSDDGTSSHFSFGRLPGPQFQASASSSKAINQFTPSVSEIRDVRTPLPARLPTIRYDSSSQISMNKWEELCFGMLTNAKIRVCRTRKPTEVVTFDEIERDKTFVSLSLEHQNDRCDILSRGTSVAVLNERTHAALKSLTTRYPGLRLVGLMLATELSQKIRMAAIVPNPNPSKLSTTMSIIVFGHRLIADSVVKELSRHRLFLQHPNPMPNEVAYENPQYLASVASPFSNGSILPPIPAQLFQEGSEAPDELPGDSLEDVASVMDNLPQHDYLREAVVDGRVTTTLLSHQKEAVDYITRKEGHGDLTKGLWRLEMSKSTKSPLYMHTITGGKSLEPEDIRGGILADGMGLGKTLTMIASIVGSLARAERFPNSQNLSGSNETLIPIKSTLVVVPSVLLLDGWIEEINKHTLPGTLTTYKYHGTDRRLSSTSPPYQIIISTYGTVAADFKRGGGILSKFHWYRLILDEAHFVRNSATDQFKAVSNISASIRWCMTGTPFQNSLNDLATLVRFLRVPLLDNPSTFSRYITGTKKTVGGLSNPDYRNLKLLLGSVYLGRRISSIFPNLGVNYVECRPSLSLSERQAYDELATSCSQSIKEAVNHASGKLKIAPVLKAILKLRMFCNTGLVNPFVGKANEELMRPDELLSLRQQNGDAMCTECSTLLPSSGPDKVAGSDSIMYNLRCQNCIEKVGGNEPSEDDDSDLPIEDIDIMQGVVYGATSTAKPDNSNGEAHPSKLQALLKDVQEHHSQSKSLVFSFWTRSLDLIGKMFDEKGIVFGRVDGQVKPSQRKSILKDFLENPTTRVLLMTIGTGAVGLNNLSVANRVYILEPQWNPSVEDQAIGRVVRLGQEKQVCVVRYIMKTTVEESIESRQMLKMQLALKGGLQYSDHEVSESKRRIVHLQALGKIIESTVLARTEPRTGDSHHL
ncbi:hypothetical protein S40293_00600 [Stachybotrys chartarum IBT 40293]|nr:hypothetical protein S40293_00600 [Stachybotrys chartarum IBT 40293]